MRCQIFRSFHNKYYWVCSLVHFMRSFNIYYLLCTHIKLKLGYVVGFWKCCLSESKDLKLLWHLSENDSFLHLKFHDGEALPRWEPKLGWMIEEIEEITCSNRFPLFSAINRKRQGTIRVWWREWRAGNNFYGWKWTAILTWSRERCLSEIKSNFPYAETIHSKNMQTTIKSPP